MISFEATKDDYLAVGQIVKRAVKIALEVGGAVEDTAELSMDLIACHANGCPLDFQRLLDAPVEDFAHDVFGIRRHIDRKTGRLGDCFVPRTAQPAFAEAKPQLSL